MDQLTEEPFRLPIDGTLDLHAFDSRDVASLVEEYLTAAQEAGLREVRIVHGRGIGVRRAIVHGILRRHPAVAEFWDDPAAHLGATFAKLRSS